MPVELEQKPPSTQPMPINQVADAMEKTMQDKLSTLLTPLQDGAKVIVTVPEAGTQPASVVPQPTTPTATPPVQPPASNPPDDPPIPEIDRPPEGMSKAGKEDWARYRALKNAEIEKRDKELTALRADVDKLKTSRAIDPAEYESTRKTKEELEATVERLRLEESPKFKAYYDGGIEKQLKLVRAVSGSLGDEVVKLIHAPRSKERNERLREIQDELGPEGHIIGNALGEIARLQHERIEQLSNWKENSKRLREVEAQESETARSRALEQRRVVADRLISRARELPEFKPDPSDKDHLAFADGAVEFIRNAAEGRLGEEDAVLLPVAAMKAQYLTTIKLPRIEAENNALKARIAELTGARPQVNGQKQGPPATGEPKHDPSDPFSANAMVKKFNELMGRSG